MSAKRYFQLYDVASDYSISPVPGKYQFGDLAHAKKQAQKLVDDWVAGMKSRARPLSAYKIKWQRGAASGSFPGVKMIHNGSIHDGELVYQIMERSKNPVRKKNPEVETRELSLYADNIGPGTRDASGQVYDIREVFGEALKDGASKKHLMSLAKHAAHSAARHYSREFGGGTYKWREIFTDKDLNNTAKYLYDSWYEEYSYVPNPRHARPPGQAPYKHKGYEIWNMGGRHWAYRKPRTDNYIGQFKTVRAAMNAIDKIVPLKKATTRRKAKKKNPVSAGDVRGHLVIAISPTGKKAAYLGSIKRARGDAFAMTKRAGALNFKSQKEAKSQLERYAPVLPKTFDKYDFAIIPASMTTAMAVKKMRGKARRSNPVGPTQKEVDRAGDLFRSFTGDHPEKMRSVKLPVPKTGLAIGELDGVLYTTVRDGKTEHYQHDFKKGSRPLLASSHDGKSLHILGGEYEFTERGIEDK